MSSPRAPSLRAFGLATVVWSSAWCAPVWDAWQHAPYDRTGPLCAAFWLAALAGAKRSERPAKLLLAAAWVATLVGALGSLNIARHAALVCAVAAWIPGWGARLGVALGAATWMPATGWLLSAWPKPVVLWGRVGVALVVCAAVWLHRRRRTPSFA
jgi:hypothetical protein